MFITNGQMVSMLLAPIIPLIVALGGCALLYHYTNKERTGILNSFGYGLIAFGIQTLVYELVVVLVQKYDWLQNVLLANRVTMLVILPVVYSVLIALCLCWGVGKVNQEKKSLIRSAAMGIGFGMGNVIWNILVPYVSSMYYAARINTGSFVGSDELALSISEIRPLAVMLDSLKSIYLIVIYMALGYVVGRYLNAAKSLLIVFLVQCFLSVTNALVRQYVTSEVAGTVILHSIFIVTALAGGFLIHKWLTKQARG